jgi:hypothetical protein
MAESVPLGAPYLCEGADMVRISRITSHFTTVILPWATDVLVRANLRLVSTRNSADSNMVPRVPEGLPSDPSPVKEVPLATNGPAIGELLRHESPGGGKT